MKYLNIKKALAAWQELQPLSDKDRERLSRRFTVDFNYNSNHIEGNTLTYGQTEILLLFGKVIGGGVIPRRMIILRTKKVVSHCF